MKKSPYICMSIVQYYRGPQQLAPNKAGFFYVGANSGFPVLISSGPSLPNPKKGNRPAEVELLTAVFGGPFFCPLTNCQQFHHAHRNPRAARSATNSTQQTGQSRNHPGQDGRTASSHAKVFCRVPKTPGAATSAFTRFLTTSAIPPAAFFTHTYC